MQAMSVSSADICFFNICTAHIHDGHAETLPYLLQS